MWLVCQSKMQQSSCACSKIRGFGIWCTAQCQHICIIYLYCPTTTAWSLSYGSNVNCSLGLIFSAFNLLTSPANTASGCAVESIQFACGKKQKYALKSVQASKGVKI